MSRISFGSHPFLLGFEDLDRLVERTAKSGSDGYPPYNIEQRGEDAYRITLAVAGFNEGDRVLVHAEPGRIELRRHDERTAKFDGWWDRFEQRYRRTLHELAK